MGCQPRVLQPGCILVLDKSGRFFVSNTLGIFYDIPVSFIRENINTYSILFFNCSILSVKDLSTTRLLQHHKKTVAISFSGKLWKKISPSPTRPNFLDKFLFSTIFSLPGIYREKSVFYPNNRANFCRTPVLNILTLLVLINMYNVRLKLLGN